jgi:hypothetical protein
MTHHPHLHLRRSELDARLEEIRQSPRDQGELRLIVRRPRVDARETLREGELTPDDGLVGDRWRTRGGSRRQGEPDPATQLTLMNARVAALVAQTQNRWALAGDQLFVDLDLSAANLPPGTRLAVGTAVIEIADVPHRGCAKFVERFGLDAMKWVNAPIGRELRLRGVYAQVVQPGRVRVGDTVRKLTWTTAAGVPVPGADASVDA